MGIFFSKPKNKVGPAPTPEPYPVQHPQHTHNPSTVSYDFNTSKGQLRAIREMQIFAWDKKEKEERIENPVFTGNRSTCST